MVVVVSYFLKESVLHVFTLVDMHGGLLDDQKPSLTH